MIIRTGISTSGVDSSGIWNTAEVPKTMRLRTQMKMQTGLLMANFGMENNLIPPYFSAARVTAAPSFRSGCQVVMIWSSGLRPERMTTSSAEEMPTVTSTRTAVPSR